MVKYREKAIKKVHGKKNAMVEKIPKYEFKSDRKFVKDKQQYTNDVQETICYLLEKLKFTCSTEYFNNCYIIKSFSKTNANQKYEFVIDEDTCCLEIYSFFPFGVYEEDVYKFILDWVEENENQTFAIFVHKSPNGVYVSSGIPFSLDYQLKLNDKQYFEDIITRYINWIKVLQTAFLEKYGEDEWLSKTEEISKDLLEKAKKELICLARREKKHEIC